MKQSTLIFAVFILLTALSAFAGAQTNSSTSLSLSSSDGAVTRGLALLDEGNVLAEHDPAAAESAYRKAAALLEDARTTHSLHNAELNRAIGNAYFKSDQLGYAVLAYRRALAIDPTNTQARDSLERARSLVEGKAIPSRGHRVLDWLLAWRGHAPRSLIWTSATALFIGAWMMVSLRIWRSIRSITLVAGVLFVLSFVGFGSILLDTIQSGSNMHAVITASSATAYTGPSAEVFDPAFQAPLNAGVECIIIESREGWAQIQLASNALGWVPVGSITTVN